MINYCIGQIEDVPELTQVLKNFHSEGWQNFADYDEEKASDFLSGTIENEDDAVLLAKKDGKIIAVMIGMVYKFAYSNTLVAGDYVWYVVPEERGSMAGIRLMKWYEAWAKRMGAVRVMTGATSGIKTDRAEKLMMRLGYQAVGGRNMIKEVSDG